MCKAQCLQQVCSPKGSMTEKCCALRDSTRNLCDGQCAIYRHCHKQALKIHIYAKHMARTTRRSQFFRNMSAFPHQTSLTTYGVSNACSVCAVIPRTSISLPLWLRAVFTGETPLGLGGNVTYVHTSRERGLLACVPRRPGGRNWTSRGRHQTLLPHHDAAMPSGNLSTHLIYAHNATMTQREGPQTRGRRESGAAAARMHVVYDRICATSLSLSRGGSSYSDSSNPGYIFQERRERGVSLMWRGRLHRREHIP